MGEHAGQAPKVAIGVVLLDAAAPTGPWRDVPAAARRAEDVGLDSLWVGDHLRLGEAPLLDAPMTLAAAAAATTRLDVGTAVFLPSLRSPAWAAAQVATLCHLAAPRRVHLGVGLGAGPDEEYRAAGVPRAGRARRTDDFLRALPQLQPTGVTAPLVWVGGSSAPALRRAAAHADGWLAAFCTAQQLTGSRDELDELTDRAGRGRLRVGLVTHAVLQHGQKDRRGRHGEALVRAAEVLVSAYGLPRDVAESLAVAGSPAAVAEQLAAQVAAGVTQVVVISDVGSWEQTCDSLAEVRRLLHG